MIKRGCGSEVLFLTYGIIECLSEIINLTYLGPVYIKRQRQSCDSSAMTLQNGFATHFQVSPLISNRTESLASLQSGRSIDADA